MYLRKGPTIEVISLILNLLFQTWIHFYFLFTILHISLSKYLTELEKLLTDGPYFCSFYEGTVS